MHLVNSGSNQTNPILSNLVQLHKIRIKYCWMTKKWGKNIGNESNHPHSKMIQIMNDNCKDYKFLV